MFMSKWHDTDLLYMLLTKTSKENLYYVTQSGIKTFEVKTNKVFTRSYHTL